MVAVSKFKIPDLCEVRDWLTSNLNQETCAEVTDLSLQENKQLTDKLNEQNIRFKLGMRNVIDLPSFEEDEKGPEAFLQMVFDLRRTTKEEIVELLGGQVNAKEVIHYLAHLNRLSANGVFAALREMSDLPPTLLHLHQRLAWMRRAILRNTLLRKVDSVWKVSAEGRGVQLSEDLQSLIRRRIIAAETQILLRDTQSDYAYGKNIWGSDTEWIPL